MEPKRHDFLRRLPPEFYRGRAYVHWSMTIEDRKTGWLTPEFQATFREMLTHTMFRFGMCCPIYCLMPDHWHLLWAGILDSADQLVAAKFFRRQMNPVLEKAGCRLQLQGYDHVLREEELERSALESVVEYIARNSERAELVGLDRYREYPFMGCLIPGYPELKLWLPDYWTRFERTISYLRKNGLVRGASDDSEGKTKSS